MLKLSEDNATREGERSASKEVLKTYSKEQRSQTSAFMISVTRQRPHLRERVNQRVVQLPKSDTRLRSLLTFKTCSTRPTWHNRLAISVRRSLVNRSRPREVLVLDQAAVPRPVIVVFKSRSGSVFSRFLDGQRGSGLVKFFCFSAQAFFQFPHFRSELRTEILCLEDLTQLDFAFVRSFGIVRNALRPLERFLH